MINKIQPKRKFEILSNAILTKQEQNKQTNKNKNIILSIFPQ